MTKVLLSAASSSSSWQRMHVKLVLVELGYMHLKTYVHIALDDLRSVLVPKVEGADFVRHVNL